MSFPEISASRPPDKPLVVAWHSDCRFAHRAIAGTGERAAGHEQVTPPLDISFPAEYAPALFPCEHSNHDASFRPTLPVRDRHLAYAARPPRQPTQGAYGPLWRYPQPARGARQWP